MALLRLVAADPGIERLFALTVDHGLRNDSFSEAVKVGEWCAALGVHHEILTWEGHKPASGIQAKARMARYDLMADWCRDNQVPVLITAHTMNDQAETVAMRRSRTESPASLAGIWPENTWRGIRIVRPLLSVTRDQLRHYLGSLGQAWLDDPSNENKAFERVRVRQSLRPGDISTLAARADVARAETQAAGSVASDWLRRHAAVHKEGYLSLPRLSLLALEQEARINVLARAIAVAGSGKRPDRSDVARLLLLLEQPAPLRRCLGGALVAARKAEVLVGREAGRTQANPVMIPPDGRLTWDSRFELVGPAGALVRPAGGLRHSTGPKIPAFVLESLPVVEIEAESVVFPHFDDVAGMSVALSERFSL